MLKNNEVNTSKKTKLDHMASMTSEFYSREARFNLCHSYILLPAEMGSTESKL